MVRKKRSFFSSSITKRLQFYFVLLIIVFMIIIQITSLAFNSNKMRELIVDSTGNEITAIIANMEQIFTHATAVCDSIQNNLAFQELMRTEYDTLSECFSSELEGNMELNIINNGFKEWLDVYLIGTNGLCCKSNSYTFRHSDYSTDSWFRTALTGTDKWYGLHEESYVGQTYNRKYIAYCKPYVDLVNGNINGAIMVEINAATFSPTLNTRATSNSSFLLLDEEGTVMYQTEGSGSDEITVQKTAKEIISTLDFQESLKDTSTVDVLEDSLIVFQQSSVNNWILVCLIPAAYLNQHLWSMLALSILLLLLMLAVAMVVASALAKFFTRPIIEMKTAMKGVEQGDLSIRLRVDGEDEMANLAHHFNLMISRIQKLVNEIYEQQKKLRQSEFKALQAQINPHFLYNSLDSIVWLMRMQQYDRSIHMLRRLSQLFRLSLSKGKEIIPVRSEMQHLDNYVAIQEIRYSKKFKAEIKVDESLLDYTTPKLILQPLVENSIYHGISLEKPFIHIRICLEEAGDDLLFTVEDDGIGMNTETLEKLRKTVEQGIEAQLMDSMPETGGYGLHNINERLKIYYGKEYGLFIDAEEWKGTKICIRIPKQATTEPDILK